MSTANTEQPNTIEGSSVDPIVAQPSGGQAPLQASDDSSLPSEEALYQWFKDAHSSLPNIQIAPGNYKLSLQSVKEVESLWDQSVAKQSLMAKMFHTAVGGSTPVVDSAQLARRTKSLQRGLSFCGDSRKLMEASEKWHTFLKQLHDKRRKVYKNVNSLHDQRLSEQEGILDDIQQGLEQVRKESKDLKQLQLDQTRIKDYPDRLSECQTVLQKILSMPQPVVSVTTEFAGDENDQLLLDDYQASFDRAEQMLTRCKLLSGESDSLFSTLRRKIMNEVDEILYQIDELSDWLENVYNLFILIPTDLSYVNQYLLVDWEKIFNSFGMQYGEPSFLDSSLLPGESSVDSYTSDLTDWEQQPKHTAECILDMIKDKLSVHKLEAKAHKLELCLARGNLIATETEVLTQLNRIQLLWKHLKQYSDLRAAELNFAIKMQRTFELVSEGQDELANFDDEYYDLDLKTLENECIDFQAFFYEIEFFPSLEKSRDEMSDNFKTYLESCHSMIEPEGQKLLEAEVENLRQEYEEMMLLVESQKEFFESGLSTLTSLHKAISKFEEWLSGAEEIINSKSYGNSYQELCIYYESVKSIISDLIRKEEDFEVIMQLANAILEQCTDLVEENLQITLDELRRRWSIVSDERFEANVYKVVELWAAYERRYGEVQAFMDGLSIKIGKEPLESSDGDTSLLPKYKAINKSIIEYTPLFEEVTEDLGRQLADHDKLGTKKRIEEDMDKLKRQWRWLQDNVTSSIDMLQQELSDWFSANYSQLERYLEKANTMLQQILAVVSVGAKFDDTLADQIQHVSSLVSDHSVVFSEENSQKFYHLLDQIFERRPMHDLDSTQLSVVLDFEPLSHEEVKKTEVMQAAWNDNWDLAKHYLILLKLRIKVLEYMSVIFDGQAFCQHKFDLDFESLETALYNYENKFSPQYFQSLQSLMKEARELADGCAEGCSDDNRKLPEGDSNGAVFVRLQELCDSLTSAVNETRSTLQLHIQLWETYNSSKEAVLAILESVQNSIEDLKEKSHDPAIPPTSIVDSAKQVRQQLDDDVRMKQVFVDSKVKLAEVLQDSIDIDLEITDEVTQVSTDWHNLSVSLNQFMSQATQLSEEFVAFVDEINQLAVDVFNLKEGVDKEVDIDLPQRDNEEYAKRMIERRMMLEKLQCKYEEFQEKQKGIKETGVSWKPTRIPQHLLAECLSEFLPTGSGEEADADWLVQNHFENLEEQMVKLQALLDEREDKLEKNEETVLVFKGLAKDLLAWLEQQLALEVMKKLPDANQEQLDKDTSVLESVQHEFDSKASSDKAQLDEQRAKLEKRSLREDTQQEIQQIADHIVETMADLKCKSSSQLAKFHEAKQELVGFLDKARTFEDWLNQIEAELKTCWPLGANLPLLQEKGVYINETLKNDIDDKVLVPSELITLEESISPLFCSDSHPVISGIPDQLEDRYEQLLNDCVEKIELIEETKNELQKFMVPYKQLAEWIEATMTTAKTSAETKHSVGVTESKLEEHKEFVTETYGAKVEEFDALKGRADSLKKQYTPSDWLDGKMKEISDQWEKLWDCCDKHRKHLEWLLEKWVAYERKVSELLEWVMTEAEAFAKDVTTRGDKGVEDHINSCEVLYANLEDKNVTMGEIKEMSEQLAEHDIRKENGTDDISSRKNDVVQHWDSLINLLAETLLRLQATSAELRHVLQVLEEESDLIGGLETRAALPPTCQGNTELLRQQIDHFQVVFEETESHNEKISFLNGYLEFVEEHSCKDDREPRQNEISDTVARHAKLMEHTMKVLTVGRQALPKWQEYNDITEKLAEWMMECNQKLHSPKCHSGNAAVTSRSLENCKVLLGEIVTQQALMDNTMGQSEVLTTFCLTEDDEQYLTQSTTHHVNSYQQLLDICRERILLLEQREMTWQNFPVAEANVVQELLEDVNETVTVEFSDVTTAADVYSYLKQLEELETKQKSNEDAVAVINRALDNEEIQKASQDNPDINEEKDRLLADFAACKNQLREKLNKVKAQVKAISELEKAINRLEDCMNSHRVIVMSDLPVGPILESRHEKLKRTGVRSQNELIAALQNLNTVLVPFNQGTVDIGVPPDINERIDSLKEACTELIEIGNQWSTKIEEAVAVWAEIKATMGKLSNWIASAESEFSSIQSIPKFLADFNALEDRFQLHADSLQEQNEKYGAFIAAMKPHLTSTEDVVVALQKKVDRLSQRWDILNKGLGEVESAILPWRQLLDSRNALEHFLAPLEEMLEVECASANQAPPEVDYTPFIVTFKDSLQKLENNEGLLLDLQQKAGVSLTEEVYQKHVPARKLHQLCEQLIDRWSKLNQNLIEILRSVQAKADEWKSNARECVQYRSAHEEELTKLKEELEAQKQYSEQLESRVAVLPEHPVMAPDTCTPFWVILIMFLLLTLLFIMYGLKDHCFCEGGSKLNMHGTMIV